MDTSGSASSLVRALLRVLDRRDRLRLAGEDTTGSEAVARTLRTTFAAAAQLGAIHEVARTGFSLQVSLDGFPVLGHLGRSLPVDPAVVEHLFKDAGAGLERGQVLLLDPAIAKIAVDEALGDCASQETRLRADRMALAAASLAADGLIGAVPPARVASRPASSSEAAA